MRALADGRVRRSEGEWREVVEKWAESGLSVAAFCRQEGLTRSSFCQARKRMEGGASAAEAPAAGAPERGGFVDLPLGTGSARAAAALSPGEHELSLPGGIRLRWRP